MRKLALCLIAALILIVYYCALAPSRQEVVAAVLILEAGGEPSPQALPAVMDVIQTRARLSHESFYAVVTKAHQFSCLDQGICSAIGKARAHAKWLRALDLARHGTKTTYAKHATHFCTARAASLANPRVKRVAVIDHHVFYVLAVRK